MLIKAPPANATQEEIEEYLGYLRNQVQYLADLVEKNGGN